MKTIILFQLILWGLYSQSISMIEPYKKLPVAYKYWVDGDLDKSINAFKQLESSEINHYNIAVMQYLLGNQLAAMQSVNKSLNEDSDFAWAYYLRGLIEKKDKQFSKAAASLQLAIDEDNDIAKFHFILADIYSEMNQKEAAIESYQDGLNIKPDEAAYEAKMVRLMMAQPDADRKDLIERLVDAATEQYPEDDLYVLLGDLYLADGNQEAAIKTYKDYFKFYPQGSFTNQIVSKLKALGVNFTPPVYEELSSGDYKIRFGERLKYRVSYGLKLGEMDIVVDDKPIMLDGKEVVRVTYYLRSTSFLLSLNAIFEAFLDVKTLNTVQSLLVSVEDQDIEPIRRYIFDNSKQRFTARLISDDGFIDYVEKELPGPTQDGTAILYYARGLVSTQRSEIVSTVIDESFKQTEIFLENKMSEESALDLDQEFHFLAAQAQYKGVAGMNGYAEGWFSTDGEFTPMVGKLSIIVGSVRVELVERK